MEDRTKKLIEWVEARPTRIYCDDLKVMADNLLTMHDEGKEKFASMIDSLPEGKYVTFYSFELLQLLILWMQTEQKNGNLISEYKPDEEEDEEVEQKVSEYREFLLSQKKPCD